MAYNIFVWGISVLSLTDVQRQPRHLQLHFCVLLQLLVYLNSGIVYMTTVSILANLGMHKENDALYDMHTIQYILRQKAILKSLVVLWRLQYCFLCLSSSTNQFAWVWVALLSEQWVTDALFKNLFGNYYFCSFV